MLVDSLYPKNRGKVGPGTLGPSDVGTMLYADGVNFKPGGFTNPGWYVWTGTAWVSAPGNVPSYGTVIINGPNSYIQLGNASGTGVYVSQPAGNAGIELHSNSGAGTNTPMLMWTDGGANTPSFRTANGVLHYGLFTGSSFTDLLVIGADGTVQVMGLINNTWVNSSTVVGWSSFTTKNILLVQYGHVLFVDYYIYGTSNSTQASFTLPFNNAGDSPQSPVLITDNGVTPTAPGLAVVTYNTNTVFLNKDMTGAAWTASGTKGSAGHFFIFV